MSITLVTENILLLRNAVGLVLTDETFSVPSPLNKKAVMTALALSEWCENTDNQAQLSQFSRVLFVRLQACFTRRHSSLKLRKEKMWQCFHRLRTSVTFCKDWEKFLHDSIGHQANPVFFQFISLTIFKHL